MKGLSTKVVEAIKKMIESKFDALSLDLIGLIPKLSKEKRIIFSTSKNNLISLFLKALGTKDPNQPEEQALQTIIRIATGYLDALKNRTTSKIIHDIDSYVRNQYIKNEPISTKKVKATIFADMEKVKKQLKLLTISETNKSVNFGTAMKISKMAEQEGEKDSTVFFIVTVDDVTGSEEFVLHLLPDKTTPRVWKLSEIGFEYHKIGDPNPKLAGLHPNCFVGNKGVNILTEKEGYKNIKDIYIGDRVLTHTGKFKKVLNTLEWYNKKYYGNFINIKYEGIGRDGKKTHTLKVTLDHKFMTQRGWVEAKDLIVEDKLKQLYTNCGNCGNKTYVKPKREDRKKLEGFFCSRKCIANFQWSLDLHRKNISKKNSVYMKKIWEKPTKKMYNPIKKANKIIKDQIKRGVFWPQLSENTHILQKNIAKINQKLQKEKTSKEEVRLFRMIKKIYPTAENQYILEKWCVDIFIPELGVNIEYDGGGHYLPVYVKKYTMKSFLAKQEGRDNYLQKCGYHILRYSSIPHLDQLKEDIERASKNYISEYFFDNVSIKSVSLIKNDKGGYKLYDLMIEDDESFVVNGVISHNCRCKLTVLPDGWGFDNEGLIKYIDRDYDEFKHQRDQYGKPR